MSKIATYAPQMPHESPAAPSIGVIAWLPVIAAASASSLTIGVLWSRPHVDVWTTAFHAAAFAAVYAGVIGAPAAHWAITSGRRGVVRWASVGAAAGSMVVLVPLLGHLVGALVRGRIILFRLTWGVLVRSILDAVGMGDLWWARRSLFLIELSPVLCGAVTGAFYWLLVLESRSRAKDRV